MSTVEGEVINVVQFPDPWPPAETRVWLRWGELVIEVDPAGRILVRFESNPAAVFTSQPIVVHGSPKAIFHVAWSADGFGVFIQGRAVALAEATMEPFVVEGQEEPAHGVHLQPPVASPLRSNDERFFLDSLVDMERKLRNRTAYDAIKAAGILRLLLLDDVPLLDRVARPYKIKTLFQAMAASIPPVQPDASWMNVDPSGAGVSGQWMDRDHFLKTVCLTLGERKATVKDVIKACANYKGGSHYSSEIPKRQGEALVLELDRTLQIVADEASVPAVAGICRVVLVAVAPLVQAILAPSVPS